MVNREIKRFVGWRIMLSVLWVHEPSRTTTLESRRNSWGDVVTGIVRHSVLGRWHSQVQSLRCHTGQDCHCVQNPKPASVSNKKVIETPIHSLFSFRINFLTYKQHDWPSQSRGGVVSGRLDRLPLATNIWQNMMNLTPCSITQAPIRRWLPANCELIGRLFFVLARNDLKASSIVGVVRRKWSGVDGESHLVTLRTY